MVTTNAPYGTGAGEEVVVEMKEVGGAKEVRFPGTHGRPQQEPVTLRWGGLTFDVEVDGEEKRILHGVSGELVPGEVVAIMGPSGAGKSTLLNVLAGRAPYGKAGGSISMNGEEVDPVVYRKRVAYVMQHDALWATQTPRELLHFTAGLKLPELGELEREELVNGTLAALGLMDCADTMVGSVMVPGLSGGERKRTAVAVELISSPSIIFLDEPTTGLDSFSAYSLVKVLRQLAERGCTIVCTIHQPSSEVFEMFDRTMLLRRGVVVYNGRTEHMVEHFAEHGYRCEANHNPADFAMFQLKQMTDDEAAPLVQHVTPHKSGSDLSGVRHSGGWELQVAPFWRQMGYLMRREAHQVVRDRASLRARVGMAVGMSLMGGLAFLGAGSDWGENGVANHYGAMTFYAINQMMSSAQALLLAFPMERPVFLREYTGGTYSTSAYFLAKTLVDIPMTLLTSLLGLVIFYFLVDMQGNFGLILLSYATLSIVSASTALLLGSLTREVNSAVSLSPVVYVPQILFAGAFTSLNAMPSYIRWGQYLCSLKYGINLVLLAEFHDGVVPDDSEPAVHAKLDRNDIVMDDLWIYCVVMAGLFLGFRLLAAIVLNQRAKSFS